MYIPEGVSALLASSIIDQSDLRYGLTTNSFTPKMAKNGSFQRPNTSRLGGNWL